MMSARLEARGLQGTDTFFARARADLSQRLLQHLVQPDGRHIASGSFVVRDDDPRARRLNVLPQHPTVRDELGLQPKDPARIANRC